MRVLGIDPGIKGAWVYLDDETSYANAGRLEFDENKSFVGFGKLGLSFDTHIVLEKVRAIPGQMGVSSAYSFGYTVGQIAYAMSIFSHSLVTPQQWQKAVLEGIDTDLNPKLRSRAGFARFNPEYSGLKLDHNFTDAFNIALYGLMKFGSGPRVWQWDKNVKFFKSKK